VWVESKVTRLLSIIHNGIILDLVCGFGGGVYSILMLISPCVLGREIFFLYTQGTSIRSCESESYSSEVCEPQSETWGDSLVMIR